MPMNDLLTAAELLEIKRALRGMRVSHADALSKLRRVVAAYETLAERYRDLVVDVTRPERES